MPKSPSKRGKGRPKKDRTPEAPLVVPMEIIIDPRAEMDRISKRPRIKIKTDLVYKLAESMLPIISIAKILGCSEDLLRTRFAVTLQRARENRKKSLSVAMWEKALIEKDVRMQIWLSKQHLGYRDNILDGAGQVNFNVICNEVPT